MADKLTIKSSELGGYEVAAKFNPKEAGIDKSVPWQQQQNSKGDAPPVEFTTGAPRELGFELLGDFWEEQKNVYTEFVEKLEKFVLIDTKLKRPPMVEIAWGGFPAFKGVVSSMNVKYTMFLDDGSPCRATVTLKVKQADKASVKSSGNKSKNKAPPGGTTSQQGQRMDQSAAAAGSGDHRSTADASGIDNPNSVPPGTTITPGSGGH